MGQPPLGGALRRFGAGRGGRLGVALLLAPFLGSGFQLARDRGEHPRPGQEGRGRALGDAGQGQGALAAYLEARVGQGLEQAVGRPLGGAGPQHAGDAPADGDVLARIEEGVQELAGGARDRPAQRAQDFEEDVVAGQKRDQVAHEGGIDLVLPAQERPHRLRLPGPQLHHRPHDRIGGCVRGLPGRLFLAQRRHLPEQGLAVEGEAGLGQGHQGGGVHHLVRLQSDHPRAEAFLEGGDVAVVQASGDQERPQGGRPRQGEQDAGAPLAQQGDEEQGEQPARHRAQSVETHVHDGLCGSLPVVGKRGVEQLVARAEERVVEDAVGAARQERAPEARVHEPQQRGRGHRGRAQGHGAGQAQAPQGGTGERHLDGQGQQANPRVEHGEERQEGLPAGKHGGGLRVEQVVEQRLGGGAQGHDQGQVAQVTHLAQEAEAGEGTGGPRAARADARGAQRAQPSQRQQAHHVEDGHEHEQGGYGQEPGRSTRAGRPRLPPAKLRSRCGPSRAWRRRDRSAR